MGWKLLRRSWLLRIKVIMADPVIENLTADTWTKVATNKTSGQVHILNGLPRNYIHTYRDTGGAAPTLASEGVSFKGITEEIVASTGIDVYVMALNAAGSVRVDL